MTILGFGLYNDIVNYIFSIVNQEQLIAETAENTGLHKTTVYHCLTGLLDVIEEKLIADEVIAIRNFGTLKAIIRKGRKGVNPSTQEKLDLPTTIRVKFDASPILRVKLEKIRFGE